MTEPLVIISVSTHNFEAMAKFYSDIGFEVIDGAGTQLCPLFNHGRGVYVRRGDFEFNLEECTSGSPAGVLNLTILDFSPDEIERAKQLDYDYKELPELFHISRQITNPDGGIVSF